MSSELITILYDREVIFKKSKAEEHIEAYESSDSIIGKFKLENPSIPVFIDYSMDENEEDLNEKFADIMELQEKRACFGTIMTFPFTNEDNKNFLKEVLKPFCKRNNIKHKVIPLPKKKKQEKLSNVFSSGSSHSKYYKKSHTYSKELFPMLKEKEVKEKDSKKNKRKESDCSDSDSEEELVKNKKTKQSTK